MNIFTNSFPSHRSELLNTWQLEHDHLLRLSKLEELNIVGRSVSRGPSSWAGPVLSRPIGNRFYKELLAASPGVVVSSSFSVCLVPNIGLREKVTRGALGGRTWRCRVKSESELGGAPGAFSLGAARSGWATPGRGRVHALQLPTAPGHPSPAARGSCCV